MGLPKEFTTLLDNMDESQLDIIAGIAVRMSVATAERFTGQISFQINLNQGGIGDMHINKGEVVRAKRARGMRSGGL